MIGITGATGVLGKIICRLLAEKGIPFVRYSADVRDRTAWKEWLTTHQISRIIYLAAIVPVSQVAAQKEEAYDVNVNGVIQLLQALRETNREVYLFYASTSHVYKASDMPVAETAATAPQNSYGLTKWLAELILTDNAAANARLTLCIGRIFSFYHATQAPPYLYPSMLQRFAKEDLSQPFNVQGALSVRDFLPAETVCAYIIALVEKALSGVYNIGSGTGTRIMDFVQAIAPQKLLVCYDEKEAPNALVADVTKLKKSLSDSSTAAFG